MGGGGIYLFLGVFWLALGFPSPLIYQLFFFFFFLVFFGFFFLFFLFTCSLFNILIILYIQYSMYGVSKVEILYYIDDFYGGDIL